MAVLLRWTTTTIIDWQNKRNTTTQARLNAGLFLFLDQIDKMVALCVAEANGMTIYYVTHKANNSTTTKGRMMMTVIGRNGFEYEAKHLANDFYVVGTYIVRVENGKCVETMTKATKAYVKAYSK